MTTTEPTTKEDPTMTTLFWYSINEPSDAGGPVEACFSEEMFESIEAAIAAAVDDAANYSNVDHVRAYRGDDQVAYWTERTGTVLL